MPGFLPYARQSIEEADIAAVVDVLRGDWLTTGPAVEALEAGLAAATGAAHALACSSGTAGLHLAAAALGLGPGDAAIVPAITFLATANAVRYTGAEPVFADIDRTTGLLTETALAEACDRARRAGLRIRAVFPVHLAGQMPDMAALHAVAADHRAVLVEDACHAIGSPHCLVDGSTVPVGACRWSSMAVFSFHAIKTIAAGEGGAVTTNDTDLAARLARLRSHGMTRDPDSFAAPDLARDAEGVVNPWYYEMAEPGWNYRLTDLQAALAASQLGRLGAIVASRAALVARYDTRLKPPVLPLARSPACLPAWHLYPVLIDFAGLGLSRGSLMRRLAARGIGTQVHYIPVYRQPYYRARNPGLSLAGADAYYEATLSLPLFSSMSMMDVDRVADVLMETLSEGGRQ